MIVYSQITNQELYDKTVENLNLELEIINEINFSGQVQIDTRYGQTISSYGLHEVDEYEKNYGFRLTVAEHIKATLISI